MDRLTSREAQESGDAGEPWARSAAAGNPSEPPGSAAGRFAAIEAVDSSEDLVGEDAKLGAIAARLGTAEGRYDAYDAVGRRHRRPDPQSTFLWLEGRRDHRSDQGV